MGAERLRKKRLRSVPGRQSPPGDPLAARLDPEPRSEVEHFCSTSEPERRPPAAAATPAQPAELATVWRLVTEPLRAPLHDHEVTDAEAALAQRRLGALDDAVFDAIVRRMAEVEGGKFLRRLVTETEEEVEAPEDVRLFADRLARLCSPGTARACFTALRGHALGRLLDALGKAPKVDALRMVRAAGGPDQVAAAAAAEALRARADEHARAIGSLSRGLAALLRIAPPSVEALRDFARSFAARPRSWPGLWAGAVARALDRAAADGEAEGPVYARPPELPPPFDEDFGARLVDAIRERRPHAPPPFQAE